MTDTVNTQATSQARENTEPKLRRTNNRYVVTFSQADYDALREFVAGTKAVSIADVRAILRKRMHYE